MSQHRCGQCGTVYDSRQYHALDRQQVNPEADNPKRQGGYERVCGECGAGFHSDKWQVIDEVESDDGTFHISTVALTIPHGLNHDHWFETLVTPPGGSEWMERYETQDQAEEGHEHIKNRLQAGKYHFESTGKRLVMNEQT